MSTPFSRRFRYTSTYLLGSTIYHHLWFSYRIHRITWAYYIFRNLTKFLSSFFEIIYVIVKNVELFLTSPSKKISKKPLEKKDFSGILKVSVGILKENENCRFFKGDVKFIWRFYASFYVKPKLLLSYSEGLYRYSEGNWKLHITFEKCTVFLKVVCRFLSASYWPSLYLQWLCRFFISIVQVFLKKN